MISISLCMIVKNEEINLKRCLDSLYGLCEEIIIVDTGSTDKTKEIAKNYTEKIYDFDWCDDFSAARNFAFSKATMDYIYSADADEVLDEINQKKFLDLKKVLLKEIDIVQMSYKISEDFNTTQNFNSELRPKLFKRLRTFTWIDEIHETVRLEPLVFNSDIEILHLPSGLHSRRDIGIFINLCKKNKRLSPRLLSMFSRELLISAGTEELFEVAPYFIEMINDTGRGEDEIMQCACILSRYFRLKNDISNFFKYALKSITANGCSEVCYELGEYFFSINDYNEAAIWFYNAVYETKAILNALTGGKAGLLGLSKCYEALNNEDLSDFYKNEADMWSPPKDDYS
ncbi:Glycosyl transferase family 2 [Acetitomaculum ruminis DSM 5522]|uniref:Glycosyl transferase family 2 n=1 Tax=Acetitomaculum ruminis DSM 5522 TaxID=1120918 RepID=A0A1I0Y1C9_9FIRM|nr:glycosyltransferase family 2 protein [Acetitomaculum ruminis]SFB06043.1 Glycosyl transferase family 2 [Acetitomaculum ruminis DSM 5522]